MPTIDDFQQNLNRRPLVEILATTFQEDIPFDGQLLTTNEEDETHPSSIVHSSGRLIVVYAKEPVDPVTQNKQIHYKFTDTDREQFGDAVTWETTVNLSSIGGVSLTELKNGNVGIIWFEFLSGNYYLQRRIVQADGTLVSTAQIDTWADTLGHVSGPTVLRLG